MVNTCLTFKVSQDGLAGLVVPHGGELGTLLPAVGLRLAVAPGRVLGKAHVRLPDGRSPVQIEVVVVGTRRNQRRYKKRRRDRLK